MAGTPGTTTATGMAAWSASARRLAHSVSRWCFLSLARVAKAERPAFEVAADTEIQACRLPAAWALAHFA